RSTGALPRRTRAIHARNEGYSCSRRAGRGRARSGGGAVRLAVRSTAPTHRSAEPAAGTPATVRSLRTPAAAARLRQATAAGSGGPARFAVPAGRAGRAWGAVGPAAAATRRHRGTGAAAGDPAGHLRGPTRGPGAAGADAAADRRFAPAGR